MKLKAILAVAALALAPSLHAYTIDFMQIAATTIPSDLVVNVPSYGDVVFSAGFNGVLGTTSSLAVGSDLGSSALQFDSGDLVYVTFLGALPDNVTFSKIGVDENNGESLVVIQTGENQFAVSLQNSTDGGGFHTVSFTAPSQVPEPSAALLGVFGLTGLVLRRRR